MPDAKKVIEARFQNTMIVNRSIAEPCTAFSSREIMLSGPSWQMTDGKAWLPEPMRTSMRWKPGVCFVVA